MRRTASEVIRQLERRIARLEKSSNMSVSKANDLIFGKFMGPKSWLPDVIKKIKIDFAVQSKHISVVDYTLPKTPAHWHLMTVVVRLYDQIDLVIEYNKKETSISFNGQTTGFFRDPEKTVEMLNRTSFVNDLDVAKQSVKKKPVKKKPVKKKPVKKNPVTPSVTDKPNTQSAPTATEIFNFFNKYKSLQGKEINEHYFDKYWTLEMEPRNRLSRSQLRHDYGEGMQDLADEEFRDWATPIELGAESLLVKNFPIFNNLKLHKDYKAEIDDKGLFYIYLSKEKFDLR